MMARLLGMALMVVALVSFADLSAQDKAKRRTGTLAGVVIAKGDSKDGRNGWIEIKADGEEKGRKYWPVGAPKGGGPDREILAGMRKAEIGARVQVEWVDAGDGKDLTKFEVLRGKK